MGSVRRKLGVEEDMTILEILHVRAGLEMFLQRVATLGEGGGEGGFVDGHIDEDLVSRIEYRICELLKDREV